MTDKEYLSIVISSYGNLDLKIKKGSVTQRQEFARAHHKILMKLNTRKFIILSVVVINFEIIRMKMSPRSKKYKTLEFGERVKDFKFSLTFL